MEPSDDRRLYRCRWSIEVFFKELKQTLQLADFLGHNANAVRWQVWTALLVYLLRAGSDGCSREVEGRLERRSEVVEYRSKLHSYRS